jgi:hypothetical protein
MNCLTNNIWNIWAIFVSIQGVSYDLWNPNVTKQNENPKVIEIHCLQEDDDNESNHICL